MVLEFETSSYICGVLAETYDGCSDEIRQGVLSFFDERLFEIVVGFEKTYSQ
ncbi:ADP-ribosylation/crystallin J1 [Streptococcus sp. NPS 308]|uniref:ADP-ribosylation/crystallin J1 n=1 Tax=Streptococcus sp. NPS 308 TaxID=1902136 RepID=UPI000BBAF113|nr:ADP-ribosylation/crystallin J1 [Streptococcus sp. NPS 308]